jgi:hypothetical protein
MPAVKNIVSRVRENRMDGRDGTGGNSDSRPCRATLGASRVPDQPPKGFGQGDLGTARRLPNRGGEDAQVAIEQGR